MSGVRSATPRRYSAKSLTTESFPEIHANVPICHCEYDGVNPTEQAEKSDNEMLPIAVVFLFQAIMSIQLSPLPLFDQTLRKIARCLGKPGWKHSLQGCGAQDMKHSLLNFRVPFWVGTSTRLPKPKYLSAVQLLISAKRNHSQFIF